jgi:hypothetical protein
MPRSKLADGKPPKELDEDASTKARAFVELARVTLARPVLSKEGQVPAGSTGTIVHVWSSGTACEVEFTRPFRAVATVEADKTAEGIRTAKQEVSRA